LLENVTNAKNLLHTQATVHSSNHYTFTIIFTKWGIEILGHFLKVTDHIRMSFSLCTASPKR